MIAEPLHVHGIAPIWIYTAPYLLRSGHAWVEITAQKTTLDMHVKPSNPERYAGLDIEGPDTADFDPNPSLDDPDFAAHFWSELMPPEPGDEHDPRPGRRRAPRARRAVRRAGASAT